MRAAHAGETLAVDLAQQSVIRHPSSAYHFDIEPFRKHCLLNGLDDIGLTLQKLDAIAAYETKQKQHTPWLAA